MSNVLSFIIRAKDEASQVMARLKSSFGGMGGALAGAFGVTAIAAFGKSVLAYAGQIKDASDATGISTERFQALSIAAKQNGVGMEQLTGALARLQNIQGSIGQEKGLQETFRKLGMSVGDVQTQNPEGLLEGIAKGLKSTGDASTAFDIFGRGASRLISTLSELEGGWDPLVEKMRSGIVTDEDIQRLDELGDMLDEFGVKMKAWSARGSGAMADAFAFWGKLSAGENWRDALSNVDNDRDEAQRKRDQKKADREAARLASQQKLSQKQFTEGITKEKDEASALDTEYAKTTLNDVEYEARLKGKVADLIKASNAKGLDAIEHQKRLNEATKATIELLQLRKKITNDIASAEKETAKAEWDYQYSKMKPKEQLAATERNIRIAKDGRDSAQTAEQKAEWTKKLTERLTERDRLKKEEADKTKERAESNESLIQRDRDLRESAMSPAQRRAASQKRVDELKGELAKETDPDKQLKLRGKLMDEAEKQAGIGKDGKPASFERSIGMGDIFTRRFGQQHKKDPAEDSANSLKSIEKILKNIEGFGPGGFGK